MIIDAAAAIGIVTGVAIASNGSLYLALSKTLGHKIDSLSCDITEIKEEIACMKGKAGQQEKLYDERQKGINSRLEALESA